MRRIGLLRLSRVRAWENSGAFIGLCVEVCEDARQVKNHRRNSCGWTASTDSSQAIAAHRRALYAGHIAPLPRGEEVRCCRALCASGGIGPSGYCPCPLASNQRPSVVRSAATMPGRSAAAKALNGALALRLTVKRRAAPRRPPARRAPAPAAAPPRQRPRRRSAPRGGGQRVGVAGRTSPSGRRAPAARRCALATTGTPAAIASAAARPKVSAQRDGHDRERGAARAARRAPRRRRGRRSARRARGAQRRAPAGRRRRRRAAARARAQASIATSTPFSGASRDGDERVLAGRGAASARRTRARRGGDDVDARRRRARPASRSRVDRERARDDEHVGRAAEPRAARGERGARRRPPRRRCRGSSRRTPGSVFAAVAARAVLAAALKHVPTAQTRR